MTSPDITLRQPPRKNYESDVCGSLPIHQINQVQPYGVLLVIDRDTLAIIQASENTERVFGLAARELVGALLTAHARAGGRDAGRGAMDTGGGGAAGGLIPDAALEGRSDKLPKTWIIRDKPYTTLVHLKGSYILAEIELTPAGDRSFVSTFQDIRHSMAAIESAGSTAGVCAAAAREHRTAKDLDYELCSVFELMSHVVSARIASIRFKEQDALNAGLHERYNRLIEAIYGSEELHQSLLGTATGVANLLSGGGAILSYRGRIYAAGDVPSRAFQEDLVLWLHTKELKRALATDAFPTLYDRAEEQKGLASGVLVIPLNWKKDEYLIVFRPEVVREINWGGNPDERIRFEPNQVNYHPRASFREWRQKVSGTSLPWRPEELTIAENLRTFIHEYIHNHYLT